MKIQAVRVRRASPLFVLFALLVGCGSEKSSTENEGGERGGTNSGGATATAGTASGGRTTVGSGGRAATGGTGGGLFSAGDVLAVVDAERFAFGSVTTSALSTSVYDLEGMLQQRTALSFQVKSNFDVNDAHLSSLLVDPSDGGYWLTGHTTRPLAQLKQAAQVDTYLVKLAADGAQQWAKQYDSGLPLSQTSLNLQLLSVDADGHAYTFQQNVHSATFSELDAQGNAVWSEEVDFDALFNDHFPDYTGASVPVDAPLRAVSGASGTSYLWGNLAPLSGGGLSQAYLWLLAKVERGSVTWSKVFSEPCDGSSVDGDWIGALGVSPDESAIYAVGPCLTRLDADGELVWTKLGPDEYPAILGAVGQGNFAVRSSENGEAIYVTTPNGGSISPSTPNKLVRYDSDGEIVWQLDDVTGGVQYLSVLPDSGELLYKLVKGNVLATTHVVRRDAETGDTLATLP